MGDFEDSLIKNELFEEEEIPRLTPSPRKRCRTKTLEDKEYGPSSPSPSKRSTASPSKKAGAPTCVEEANDVDRMIWQMKEEGKPWSEIQVALDKCFGEQLKTSALSMRYTRMKRNFAVINEADVPNLIEAKKAVDMQFERERWNKVAVELERRGGGKYDGAVLHKRFKQLEKDALV
ncbi:hypothetical protein KEM56_001554 [Ascosphaera pollenicola]|nr:hypothetical protein KEM56_001554 [Ascosphaera pollenicola]